MRTIRFDCRGRNSPAYGCNVPGDNTGEYVTVEEYNRLREVVEKAYAKPCQHPGCMNHITHPCEGCGRQWGALDALEEGK